MKVKFFIILVVITSIFFPSLVSANYKPGWDWKTIQTENFTIYYPEGHEPVAQRILSLSNEVYKDVTGYMGSKPPKCPIVINPGTDIFNGFFSPLPNRISLYETPPFYLRGFGPSSDIVDTVFTHEFTHFVHLTAAAGWYRNISALLGPGSSISNILSPGWAIEGITTNTETMFTDGGRGRCSYFKGQFLSCTEDDGLWSLSAAGVYSPYRPPGNRFYLSGYFMVKYLNDNYGKDAFARLSRYQAKHPVGGTSKALKHVTGKKPAQFYSEFKAYIKSTAVRIKEAALATNLPQGKTLLSEKYETIKSHFWTDKNTIIALRTGYDKKNALLEIDPTAASILDEIRPGRLNAISSLKSLKNSNNDIVFSGFYPHPLGNGQLSSTDITTFDKRKKTFHRITKNSHIFSADFSPSRSSFVAARRNGMWIDLVLINSNGDKVTPLFSKPGYYFESPVWSPDGRGIATVIKSGQNADIAFVNPESGAISTLFKTDVYEDNEPAFSPDGKWIVFSSNRKGTWNIFAWQIEEKNLYQLTSVFYGASEPKVSPDGKTLSFLSLYNGVNILCSTDFEPETGKKIDVYSDTEVLPPDLKRVTPEATFTAKNIPFKDRFRPFLHIPYFSGDEDSRSIGIWLNGGDPVGLNSYSASIFHKSVSDISSRAGTADEEDTKGYPGYDILLVNNSFWPTLQLRFSEDILNGSTIWYRERLTETGAGINLINQTIPSQINTLLFAGGRYRHRTSLSSYERFYYSNNDSSSLFGELSISRFPDYPARNIIPTHGQQFFISYEEGVEILGGESQSHNTIVSGKQFLPSIFNNHGIKLKGVYQEQKGLLYSKGLSLPRGFSESDRDGGLHLPKNILLSGEYHFPLAYPDKGLGLSLFHINALKSSVFFDWGAGWHEKFQGSNLSDIARKSIGGSLTCKASVFSLLAFETGIEAGYKIEEKENFVNFVFIAGF